MLRAMPSGHRRSTRRLFLRRACSTVGALGVASLLAACQQPLPTPEPTPIPRLTPRPTAAIGPAETPTPATRASPTPAARRPGGATIWAAEGDPGSLDPHKAPSFASLQAWGDLTYQSLTQFDENLKVVPALAESWATPNPTTWVFRLRQGVRFHDGSELTADDVVFWHERLMARETAAPFRDVFEVIQRVEARDPYTVTMTLRGSHAPLLTSFAAMRGSAIVPRRWAANADLAGQAVGTGPFRIVEYVPRSHIRYARHPDYWERGLPHLDEVTVKILPDEEARVASLRSGEVAYAALSADGAHRLGNDPNIRVLSRPGPSQQVHNLNVRRAPFNDIRVRRAIALTIDRQAALDAAIGGQGNLTGPLPTGHGDWVLPPDPLPYARNVARAFRFLDEAGYEDGFTTVIKTTPDVPAMLTTSHILAEQLRVLGVRAEVQQIAWDALLRDIAARDYDIVSNSNGFFADPDGYLSLKYHSGGAQNFSQWSNPRFDELVNQARITMEPPERKRLYDQAQAILLDEAPLIWWFTENQVEALHATQKGYAQSYTGRRMFLKKTRVDV